MTMSEDRFSDRELLLSALSDNGGQLTDVLIKRRLYLRDLARIAAEDVVDRASAVYEAGSETFNLFRERMEAENSDGLFNAGVRGLTDAASTASLAYYMTDEARPEERIPYTPEGSRICYFRNRFSDCAYLSFEKLIKDASAFYVSDVTSACEEVYFGRADYCVIPIENYSDGNMPRFIGLIRKYELFIAAACKVTGKDGEFVTLALLCASPARIGEPARLAVTAVTADDFPVWKLITAAELLGARLISYNTLPERIYPENAGYLVFDVRGADIRVLETCFQLTLPSWSEIGVYGYVETELK